MRSTRSVSTIVVRLPLSFASVGQLAKAPIVKNVDGNKSTEDAGLLKQLPLLRLKQLPLSFGWCEALSGNRRRRYHDERANKWQSRDHFDILARDRLRIDPLPGNVET